MSRQFGFVDTRSEALSEGSRRLPPATPAYILRGHGCAVHALDFYAENSRLVSGDAEGWVIAWDLATRRAAASWRAHIGAILRVEGIAIDGERRIFTHGRDHKLRVWRLNPSDEEHVGKVLPADEASNADGGLEPWLLHSLDVNALNFCAFSFCTIPSDLRGSLDNDSGYANQPHFYIAVPNSITEGGIDIFHLPSQRRVSRLLPDPLKKTGMLMAVGMFMTPSGKLCIASGYEEGTSMVHVHDGTTMPNSKALNSRSEWIWEKIYSARVHSQPVLSLSLPTASQKQWFITSSADAVLAKHPIPIREESDSIKTLETLTKPIQVMNTKHAGQQGLDIRLDDKIFATAGWDNKPRVYSCATMRELAVLKWHRQGCFAVAFADPFVQTLAPTDSQIPSVSPQGARGGRVAANDLVPISSSLRSEGLTAVKQKRSLKAITTHWLAAGGKDHKISLWDIY
ncbi:ASTRA complex subunit [Ascosphaera aggregata]|nr:ASTRA complex subunit [Ascosphaera aggregata]